MSVTGIIIIGLLVLITICILAMIIESSIYIVPQSQNYVVEQFGKFHKLLKPGLNFIIPGLQKIAHKVDMLERQLPTREMSVITEDNVEFSMEISVFYRVISAQDSVYKIKDIDNAVNVTSAAIIRSACGAYQFDDIQSQRESLIDKIKADVAEETKNWGISITKTEILGVIVNEKTRQAMELQITAEREKRAEILKAEGQQRAIQIGAQAELYKAEREAQAKERTARAEAYAAKAIADAMKGNDRVAVDYEIMKLKVDAIKDLAGAQNSKILVLPSDVTGVLGALETVTEMVRVKDKHTEVSQIIEAKEKAEDKTTDPKDEALSDKETTDETEEDIETEEKTSEESQETDPDNQKT